MTPRDFLEVADTLAAGNKEADWRSAVSRAYYAAFHSARVLMRQCGFKVPDGEQAHAYLWLRLSNCGHADLLLIGRELKDLRSKRNWADYNLDRAMNQATAIGFLQAAESIIQLLEEAAVEATARTKITDAIKVYERDVLGSVTWRRQNDIGHGNAGH